MDARFAIVMSFLLSAACCSGRSIDWDGYVSMYGGWSQTGSGTVEGSAKEYIYDVDGQLIGGGIRYPINNSYDSDGSFLVGTRAGIWLPETESRLGIAGDISISQIDSGSDNTEIILVPLSALLLYRFPLLVSEDFQHGRLQPYVGIGLAVVLGDVSTRVERNDGSTYTAGTIVGGVGGSAHVGCAWCIDQHWSVFFEYRYLLTDELSGSEETKDWYGDFDDETYTATHASMNATAIDAHHLYGGVTFTF